MFKDETTTDLAYSLRGGFYFGTEVLNLWVETQKWVARESKKGPTTIPHHDKQCGAKWVLWEDLEVGGGPGKG